MNKHVSKTVMIVMILLISGLMLADSPLVDIVRKHIDEVYGDTVLSNTGAPSYINMYYFMDDNNIIVGYVPDRDSVFLVLPKGIYSGYANKVEYYTTYTLYTGLSIGVAKKIIDTALDHIKNERDFTGETFPTSYYGNKINVNAMVDGSGNLVIYAIMH